MPKYCKNCGEKLPDEAKFCKSCGKSVDSPAPQDNILQAKQKNYTIFLILGIIAALTIPLIGIIFAVYLYSRKNSNNAKTYGIIVGLVTLLAFIFGGFIY